MGLLEVKSKEREGNHGLRSCFKSLFHLSLFFCRGRIKDEKRESIVMGLAMAALTLSRLGWIA